MLVYYKQVSVYSLYAIQDFVCKNGPWETLIRIKHQPSQQIILQKEPSFFISCVFLVLQFIVSMAEEILPPWSLYMQGILFATFQEKKLVWKKLKQPGSLPDTLLNFLKSMLVFGGSPKSAYVLCILIEALPSFEIDVKLPHETFFTYWMNYWLKFIHNFFCLKIIGSSLHEK